MICPIKKVPNPPALISSKFLGFIFSGIAAVPLSNNSMIKFYLDNLLNLH